MTYQVEKVLTFLYLIITRKSENFWLYLKTEEICSFEINDIEMIDLGGNDKC